MDHVKMRLLRGAPLNKGATQNGLNRLYVSMDLKLASNCGEALLGVGATMFYSSAMPILYYVACFGNPITPRVSAQKIPNFMFRRAPHHTEFKLRLLFKRLSVG